TPTPSRTRSSGPSRSRTGDSSNARPPASPPFSRRSSCPAASTTCGSRPTQRARSLCSGSAVASSRSVRCSGSRYPVGPVEQCLRLSRTEPVPGLLVNDECLLGEPIGLGDVLAGEMGGGQRDKRLPFDQPVPCRAADRQGEPGVPAGLSALALVKEGA